MLDPWLKNINKPAAYDFEKSTMTSGAQGPSVRGSVEASSPFKSTTVGKFDFEGD